jgi:hypothetical protein
MSRIKFEVEVDFTNPAQVAAMCVFMKAMEASAGKVKEASIKVVEAVVVEIPEAVAKTLDANVAKMVDNAKADEKTEPTEKEAAEALAVLGKDVRTLISAKVQANRPAVKGKLDELGVPNVTKLIEAKDTAKLEDMKTFLEGLK